MKNHLIDIIGNILPILAVNLANAAASLAVLALIVALILGAISNLQFIIIK